MLNALAAICVAYSCGCTTKSILNTLKNFQGVNRRFNYYACQSTLQKHFILIDDYAHHPSEMLAVLSATKDSFAYKRLILVFQPHRYTRTRDLFNDFLNVFVLFDYLFLLPVYAC